MDSDKISRVDWTYQAKVETITCGFWFSFSLLDNISTPIPIML